MGMASRQFIGETLWLKQKIPIISVSGVRGQISISLDARTITRFALAFGTYVGGKSVVIGRDSRTSSPNASARSASRPLRYRVSRH